MKHTCKYCSKELPAGSKAENVQCTCDKNESQCELPESIVCDGPVCTMKLQLELYEIERQELIERKQEIKQEINQHVIDTAKLKQLNNSFRLLGFSPESLETFIKNFGLNIPGVFINKDERFTWDQLKPEDLATVGLTCMNEYAMQAKYFAAWLNEKSVKLNIKKEQLAATQENLKKAKKLRETKSSELTKVNEAKKRVALTDFEKIVQGYMKSMKCSQEMAEGMAKAMPGFESASARNLKALGLI